MKSKNGRIEKSIRERKKKNQEINAWQSNNEILHYST